MLAMLFFTISADLQELLFVCMILGHLAVSGTRCIYSERGGIGKRTEVFGRILHGWHPSSGRAFFHFHMIPVLRA